MYRNEMLNRFLITQKFSNKSYRKLEQGQARPERLLVLQRLGCRIGSWVRLAQAQSIGSGQVQRPERQQEREAESCTIGPLGHKMSAWQVRLGQLLGQRRPGSCRTGSEERPAKAQSTESGNKPGCCCCRSWSVLEVQEHLKV